MTGAGIEYLYCTSNCLLECETHLCIQSSQGGPFDHDVHMEPAPLPISRDFQAFRVDEKEQRTPIDLDLKNDISDCLYEGHLEAGDRRFTDEKMIASVCDGGLVSETVVFKI